MQQLASSTRFNEHPTEERRDTTVPIRTEEDWIALEQRCNRLEKMVGELLLKNAALRMQAASLQTDDE